LSAAGDQAALLVRKASEDLAVIVALIGNAAISDSVLGFHGQQAVVKALKAVLAAHGQDFPWTHDLQLLLRRLEAAGVAVPDAAIAARRLAPWAVEFRYGETVDGELDRSGTLELVTAVLEWAELETRRTSPG